MSGCRGTRSRLAVFVAVAVLMATLSATTPHARAGCDVVFAAMTGPEPDSPVQLVGGAWADALTFDGVKLTRLRGHDGRLMWRSPKPIGEIALITGRPGREVAMAIGGARCGGERVSVVDTRSGEIVRNVSVPGVMTPQTQTVEYYNAGFGDWDGDGKRDLLQVQTAIDGAVVNYPNGDTASTNGYAVGQPSGHLLVAGYQWHSWLNIISSGGRLLRHEYLGEGRGPAPTARWTVDGQGITLAVPTTAALTVTRLSQRGTLWRRVISGNPGTDVALVPHHKGVVVVVSLATAAFHAHALLVNGLADNGSVSWTQQRLGALDVLPPGGGLTLVDMPSGIVERLDLVTGTTRWQSAPLGPQESFLPIPVGDLDGGGEPDILLCGSVESSVLSAETGRRMFTYPTARTFATVNLDGTPGDDLLTKEAAQGGQGEITTLRRGLDGHVVWSRTIRLPQGSQGIGAVATRGAPHPLLVVNDVEGGVISLNPRDGRERWRVRP